MAGEPINFLDASTSNRSHFATALQLNAERALWALEESASDPTAMARIGRIMQQLHGLSIACGNTRVAAICQAICSLIEGAAADLLQGVLAELKALRRIVVAALQDNAGDALCAG